MDKDMTKIVKVESTKPVNREHSYATIKVVGDIKTKICTTQVRRIGHNSRILLLRKKKKDSVPEAANESTGDTLENDQDSTFPVLLLLHPAKQKSLRNPVLDEDSCEIEIRHEESNESETVDESNELKSMQETVFCDSNLLLNSSISGKYSVASMPGSYSYYKNKSSDLDYGTPTLQVQSPSTEVFKHPASIEDMPQPQCSHSCSWESIDLTPNYNYWFRDPAYSSIGEFLEKPEKPVDVVKCPWILDILSIDKKELEIYEIKITLDEWTTATPYLNWFNKLSKKEVS